MKQLNEQEILHVAASYCSMAERCICDVSKKIASAGASPEAGERIIAHLLKEKFIDEARYCRGFVNDKFRFNRWGRIKIGYELRGKIINDILINEAMSIIDDDEYESILFELLKEKKRTVKGKDGHDIFSKLYRYAINRGFESALIVQQLRKLLNTSFDVDMD
jgi:regulatory protein